MKNWGDIEVSICDVPLKGVKAVEYANNEITKFDGKIPITKSEAVELMEKMYRETPPGNE